MQDGKLISNSGSSIPYKFIIKDDKIVDYKIPEDGTGCSKSIKKILLRLDDSFLDGNKRIKQIKEHYLYLKE